MESPRRPYHHGNLREAFLEAAERAVEAAGAGSVTLRELSHASPRRHFADKQALLDALAQRGFERLGTVLARAAKDRGQGFDERLTQLARAHVRFALKHPSLFGLMLEAKHRCDAPAALLQASGEARSSPVIPRASAWSATRRCRDSSPSRRMESSRKSRSMPWWAR